MTRALFGDIHFTLRFNILAFRQPCLYYLLSSNIPIISTAVRCPPDGKRNMLTVHYGQHRTTEEVRLKAVQILVAAGAVIPLDRRHTQRA